MKRAFLRSISAALIGAVGVGILVVRPAGAQWRVTVSSLTTYDQNAFRNYLGLDDWVQQVLLSVGKQFTGRHADVALSYNGGFVIFREYTERRFMVHGAALDATLYLAGGNFPVDAGISYSRRFDTQSYDIFDNRQFVAYVSKRFAGVAGLPEVGFSYANRAYPNLPGYTHSEWSFYAVARKFLPTKTTLILRSNVGYRAFARRVYPMVEPIGEDWMGGSPWGWMRGGHGRGHWQDLPWWPGPPMAVHFLVDAPRILLLNGGFRLAQSLGQTLGLSLDVRGWYSPSGGGRALDRSIYGYDPADLLYDDPYNYNGQRWSAQLNWLPRSASRLQVGAAVERRAYRDLPALDLAGEKVGVPRSDRRLETWVTLQSSLPFGLSGLSFLLDLRWLSSDSNDPYYTWQGYAASVGLEYVH